MNSPGDPISGTGPGDFNCYAACFAYIATFGSVYIELLLPPPPPLGVNPTRTLQTELEPKRKRVI